MKDRKNVSSVDPTAFIDFNYNRSLHLGYLSLSDITDITREAHRNIQKYYGINISAGNPVGGGVVTGPYWIYFPTEVGTDDYMYKVSFDSGNLIRGITGDWIVVEVGALLVFTQPGNFTSGINVGQRYFKDDIVSYTDNAMLKLNGNWIRNREQHLCFTRVTGRPITNMYQSTTSNSVIKFDCTDVGKSNPSILLVTNMYNPDGNNTDEIKRSVWTWSK